METYPIPFPEEQNQPPFINDRHRISLTTANEQIMNTIYNEFSNCYAEDQRLRGIDSISINVNVIHIHLRI